MQVHWLILSVLIVIALQAWLYRRFGQRRLTYARSFDGERCFVGDEMVMVEEISNRKLLPLPWLRVESLLHSGMQFRMQFNLDISNGQYVQNHKSFFSMLPHSKITRKHYFTCSQRGVYRIHSVSLTCGDVLGLSRTHQRVQLQTELIVYPLPLPPEQLQLPFHSWQGDISVKRWVVEDPFLITGVRAYRSGDSMKDVNWKATAKTGHLQVHQRDYTADYKLMILLNIEDHERMWNVVNELERVEHAIAYCAGLSHYAITNGMEVGFAANGYDLDELKRPVRIEPESGDRQLTVLYEKMARLVIEPSVSFVELLDAERNMAKERYDYYILSAYVSDAIQQQLDQLINAGHHVTVVSAALPNEQATKAGNGGRI